MNKATLLDSLFDDISNIILKRQHPVTGLLPASTAITTHGDYTDAWVRDNVYSIMSVWSLSMAYRHSGDKVRCDELEQSTIKLMRGLLQSMMRQSNKVETFKHTLDPLDCLHAKYDTATGLTVVEDHEWGHLQIDATSIFLLMIAQMTASGLRIINTIDEVDFVQNLIYYIAFAYRTPDYGIWERGNKINNGNTEINASSVGMAKAALQALDGFNLFGKDGSERAIVHTVPDAISRARNTLARLLPRESISKEVDSALLSIIGFPAFAVGDKEIVDKTRNKILSELGGNYGCKRFLWDGHQTAIEDHSRIHYDHSELANFANIESEWPLFYTYLYIQALFENDQKKAKQYRERLESVMVDVDGRGLLPELYFVAKENIEAERQDPKSQDRVPNENVPLVWAQSLYFTGLMLDEGLIKHDDLDPLNLRTRSSSNTKAQVALVVLAENDMVKQHLADKSVLSESIDDIAPIKVISAAELVKAYRQVGANESLGLSGRPKRRFQGLATAQTYHINQQSYLSLSSLQYAENNYRQYDAELASANLQREIAHISKHWINDEVAVFSYMITQDMCAASNADVLFDCLREFQLRVKREDVSYASATLAIRASRVNHLIVPNLKVTALDDTPSHIDMSHYTCDMNALSEQMQAQYTEMLSDDNACYQQLLNWQQSYPLDTELSQQQDVSVSFQQLVFAIYNQAQRKQFWLTSRLCFSLLKLAHQDIADDVSLLCARHLSIVIGHQKQTVLAGYHALLKPKQLVEILDNSSEHPLERTLAQELLMILGNTIRTNTAVFRGLRSIQLHNLLALCANQPQCDEQTLCQLAALSPHQLSQQVLKTLESQQQAFALDVEFSFADHAKQHDVNELVHAMDTDWLQWRSARGLITRFDDDFLTAIWNSLANAKRIVFADHEHANEALDSAFVRSSMTPREESFAHSIDVLIQHLHPIYYKAAIVEVLYGFTQFVKANPDKQFNNLVLGQVLELAADLYAKENQQVESNYDRHLDALMTQSPKVLQDVVAKALSELA